MVNRAWITVVSVLLDLLETAAHRVIVAVWATALSRTVYALAEELVQGVSLPSWNCSWFQVCSHWLKNFRLSLDGWKMWWSLQADFWPLEKVWESLIFVNSSVSIINRLGLGSVPRSKILAFGGWCSIHECSFAIIVSWTIIIVFIFIDFI